MTVLTYVTRSGLHSFLFLFLDNKSDLLIWTRVPHGSQFDQFMLNMITNDDIYVHRISMTVALTISIRNIPRPCPVALCGFTLISDTIIH
jgi:hypothetical protein